MIKYNDEFKATRVIVITFKGNFVVFISRNPKPDKEKHDFMYSINSFVVDYKHQTAPITDIFINILALTEFKGAIKIEFTKEKILEENKRDNGIEMIKRTRNSSLPSILTLEEGGKSCGNMSKNETYFENSRNVSQNNSKFHFNSKKNGLKHDEMSLLNVKLFIFNFCFFILNKSIFVNNYLKFVKKQQETERKYMKVQFKRDQKAIQMIFEKKISLMKKLQRKDEVRSQISENLLIK